MRPARLLLPGALVALGSCVASSAPPALAARPMPPPPPPAPSPASLRFVLQGPMRQGGVVLGTAPAGTRTLTLDGAPVPLAPDRRFLIAFDRDAAPRALLRAVVADGRVLEEPLAVAPGNWRNEPVDAPLTAGRPSAEMARLR